jgi:glutaredoxin-like YruB-family protein
MSVVVFSTPTCGFCHQLKSYLHQRGVPFTEYDVSRDQNAAAQMVQLSGQQGVPVTSIDGQVVVGFNRPIIDRLLAQQGAGVNSAKAARSPKLGVAIAEASRIAAKQGTALPDGAFVGRVTPGSSGAVAGLRAGDVITEFAGQPIHTDGDVHRVMAGVNYGQSLDMLVWRDGQTLRVTLRF